MASIAAGWPTSRFDNAIAMSLAKALDRVLDLEAGGFLYRVSLTPLLCEAVWSWTRSPAAARLVRACFHGAFLQIMNELGGKRAGWFLLVPVGDSTLGQIIGGEFQSHTIAGQHSNPISAQLTSQVGKDGAFLVQLHAKQAAWKFFYDCSSYLNTVFFAHRPAIAGILPDRWDRFRVPF